jgi:hypothetical protein
MAENLETTFSGVIINKGNGAHGATWLLVNSQNKKIKVSNPSGKLFKSTNINDSIVKPKGKNQAIIYQLDPNITKTFQFRRFPCQ